MKNNTSCLGRGPKSWSDWDKGVAEGEGMVQAKEGSGDKEAKHG